MRRNIIGDFDFDFGGMAWMRLSVVLVISVLTPDEMRRTDGANGGGSGTLCHPGMRATRLIYCSPAVSNS